MTTAAMVAAVSATETSRSRSSGKQWAVGRLFPFISVALICLLASTAGAFLLYRAAQGEQRRQLLAHAMRSAAFIAACNAESDEQGAAPIEALHALRESNMGPVRGGNAVWIVSPAGPSEVRIEEAPPAERDGNTVGEGSWLATIAPLGFAGKSGVREIEDDTNGALLAAYAPIPTLGWTAITATTRAQLREPFVPALTLTALIGLMSVVLCIIALVTLAAQDETRQKRGEQQLREAHDHLATANRQLKEEHRMLVHAEKLSSIGLLASGVAHEINNPLSGVMACVKALQSDRIPADRRDEYFDTARDGLERIQGIVRGLLDYAKQRPPRPTPVDMHEVVVSCLRLVAPAAHKKALRVENEIPAARQAVQADRSQLMQAVVNVLLNAIHAVSAGGSIRIHAVSDDDQAGIRISDNGPGIPPDILKRICDPFFTTKPEGEGTGLGLAVSQGIIDAHGGKLEIESELSRGTTVTLWLPIRPDSSPLH